MQDDDSDFEELANEWDAERAHHEETARLLSRWRGVPASAVVSMWRDGLHHKTGRRLTPIEMEALVERWCELFGELPPSKIKSEKDRARPLEEHPLFAVPDDKMLRPRDITRICGVPRTTLKRWRKEGKFPKPQLLSPHAKHIGWPARQVKAWLTLSESGEVAGNG